MAEYGESKYWDSRYKNETEPFEWYQDYFSLKDILKKHVDSVSSVLVPGCGNSRLSEQISSLLTKKPVLSIDISPVVIEQMQHRYNKNKQLAFQVMDIRSLTAIDDRAVDVIVDKGTLDCMFVLEDAQKAVQDALLEYSRVLRPGGVCLIVSHGTPNQRVKFLQDEEKYCWKLQGEIAVKKPSLSQNSTLDDDERKDGHEEDDGEVHYVYVCVKGAMEF